MKPKVIFEAGNNKGLPGITRIGNLFVMTESSIPNFASVDYSPFLLELDEVISNEKNIILEMKMNYYNTGTNAVLVQVCQKFSKNAHICRPTINWYYLEDDEMMFEKGEMLQETYGDIQFNFSELKD